MFRRNFRCVSGKFYLGEFEKKREEKRWKTICLAGFKKLFSLPTWKNVKFSTSWMAHTGLTTTFRQNFPVVTALWGKESSVRVRVRTAPFQWENRPGVLNFCRLQSPCCFPKRLINAGGCKKRFPSRQKFEMLRVMSHYFDNSMVARKLIDSSRVLARRRKQVWKPYRLKQ